MAVPKKRTSVSRKGLRRAGQHHKLYPKYPMQCPNCQSTVLPHHVCPSCGTYRGKEVFTVKVKEEAEENSQEQGE